MESGRKEKEAIRLGPEPLREDTEEERISEAQRFSLGSEQ